MAEIINQIASVIEQIVLAIGYPGVFLIMFIENLFPPIPTDPLLPFAGILAAEGALTFGGIWLAAVTGALTGSLLLYGVGKWADANVVRGFIRRYGKYLTVTERELDRMLELFNRYGASMIFFGRMIPVLRSAVSITAGMSRMPVHKFILYSALNSTLITGFWIAVGYVLGENWQTVLGLVDQFEPLLIALIGVALGGVALAVIRRLRLQRTVRGVD